MRFVCESCRAQYMINDDKVGPKGVKVRCRKCGYVILVKKTEGAKAASAASVAANSAPVALSNDPDDALATQVMQNPLNEPEQTTSDATNPGTERPPTVEVNGAAVTHDESRPADSFLGADEDEIGAVFDQVLKTGPQAMKDGAAKAPLEDDRQSTRVLDAELVRKLAEESTPATDAAPSEAAKEEVPQTDWYIAIDEKQTGPLTLDKIKEHWDRGEVGPDSLCWRNGFADWIPVSEVKMLGSVLAPKPPKPIVVAPAAAGSASAMGPSVMSVPVQSAFSAGGVVQTVQSEMQVPIAAAPPSSVAEREESGTWKPSAASALASLVKDEMAALAKPPPKKVEPQPEEAPGARGLLDLPGDEKPVNGHASAPVLERPAHQPPRQASQAPVNPYMQNQGATFSAPAVSQYRPPLSRGLIYGLIAAAALVLLGLIGVVGYLATHQQPAVAQQPPPPQNPLLAQNASPPPPQPGSPVAQPAQPAAAQPAGQPSAQPAAPPQPTAAQPQPNPAKEPVRVAKADPPERRVAPKRHTEEEAPAKKEKPEKVEKAEKPERVAAAPKDDPDDFDSAFGTGETKKQTKKEAAAEKRAEKKDVYIPAAPGGAGVKDSLGSSDIMEVVLANKSALANCVQQQRAKDSSVSGKLVMRWTVQTSGRTSNITVVTEEFKGSVMATCVTAAIRSWQFPRSKTQGDPVDFPFKF